MHGSIKVRFVTCPVCARPAAYDPDTRQRTYLACPAHELGWASTLWRLRD